MMRALNLDFRRKDRAARWGGVLCIALGMAAVVVLGMRYDGIANDLAQLEASMRAGNQLTRKQAVPARSEGDVQTVALEVKHARDILLQLNVPWDELLAGVEAASIADVALLSIDSDVDGRRVNLAGEAKNLAAMLQYTRSLQARPVLAEIYLQSHEVQERDPQRPVRFVLTADWRVSK